MTALSDIGKQQRAQLVLDIAVTILDIAGATMDDDVIRARAVVEMLEKRGLVRFQRKYCPQCGRDRLEAERGVCGMGGCPCGGDL